MEERVTRTERGWAGHYICSYKCLFRRNTLLEYGDVKVVVSTVGCDRYYETRAFMANMEDTRFYDADTGKPLDIEGNTAIDHLDADDDANDMHEAVVEEIAEHIKQGHNG